MKFLLSIIFVLSTFFGCAANPNGEKLPESMRDIVAVKIPKMEAKDATLIELVDFIATRIRELDPQKPRGLSLLTNGFGDRHEGNALGAEPKNDDKKFNYSSENVSVGEVFVDLARLCQVEFHITSVGVVVTPIGSRPFPNNKADKGEIYYTYKQTAGE